MTALINKHIAQEIEKYSFIDSATIKGTVLEIEYTFEGIKKVKKVPRRASIQHLQKILKSIEKEMDLGVYGKALGSNVFITTDNKTEEQT
jgi:hypothetical protein